MTIFEMVSRLVGGMFPSDLTNGSAQSKFFYTNKLNREIVERRIADLGFYAGLNKSQIIEDTLTGALLPKHGSTAARYVNQVLLGKLYVQKLNSDKLVAERYGIREALVDIFRRNCHGTKEAYHDNLEPLVYFLREILPASGAYFVLDDERPGMRRFACEKMRVWINRVNEAKGLEPLPDKLECGKTSLYGADYYLLRLSEDNPEILPFNYVLRVLDEWDICKGWAATYEFLAAFIEILQEWNDTELNRIEFQKLCEQVMNPWDDEAEPQNVGTIETRTVTFDEQH